VTQGSRLRQRSLAALFLLFLASGCVGFVAGVPELEAAPELELTRAGLLHAKGPPSATRTDADGETWLYRGKFEPAGVVLLVGAVPVPLLLPVRTRTEVQFNGEDEAAASARVRTVSRHVRVCGFMGPCGFGPPSCSIDDD